MRPDPNNRRRGLIYLGLLLGTFVVYAPVRHHTFINFDDTLYVTANPHVQGGLNWEGVKWAFGRVAGTGTYWHPLTWLSHMLDCQLFGLLAGAHHLVNVLFHAANALLLFAVLKRLTKTTWRSAMVAALFALHPLQVDSVAWVAERKNLLSASFWMLTLLAYARYSQRPGLVRYLAVWVCFALGLMAKPSLVVLPFVLLLLDFWPLRRLRFRSVPQTDSLPAAAAPVSLARAVIEKAPLLALSAVSCVVTLMAHERLALIHSLEHFPLGVRAGNAVVSYARYIGKIIWPGHLTIFYPHPGAWPGWTVAAAALLLAGLSVLALRLVQTRPYLAVGWLWFLGALVPVIGLVQVSDQAMADRFAYLPLIGLLIAGVWSMADMAARWANSGTILRIVSGGVLLACAVRTEVQVQHWRDSESLFRHALAVTHDNYVAHNNLGTELVRLGRLREAKSEYEAAVQIRPQFGEGHYNLANLLFLEGNLPEALHHYSAAVQFQPGYAQAHFNLGITLMKLGRVEEAISQYRAAAQLKPDLAEAHHSLGGALAQKGQIAEAVQHLSETVRLRPNFAQVRNELGILLAQHGDPAGAETNFAALVHLEPYNADAHYNLANSLAAQNKLKEAAAEYAETLHLNPQDQKAREKLARLQKSGQFLP